MASSSVSAPEESSPDPTLVEGTASLADETATRRDWRERLTNRIRPGALNPSWVVALATSGVLAVVYIVYAVQRYERLGFTGWDLGIFTQAVKAYSHFEAPIVPLEGTDVNLMGDHFQPWIALIGPIYRVFPSPITLLVVQALLFAVAAIPIVRLATKNLGVTIGILIAVAYGLAWGVTHALAFDFHEIALAVPLLAFSLVAVVEGRWRAALLYALPLVFCKEDLGLTVAVLAVVVALRFGRPTYTWAAATAVWGLVWSLLAAKVIIPAFATGDYSYESKFAESPAEGVRQLVHGFANGDARVSTAFMLVVITVFLAVRSPIALVALPTIAWRFWSTNQLYWSDDYHYDAALMPIMFVAMIDTMTRMQLQNATRKLLTALAAGAAVIAIGLAWGGPLHRLVESDFYSPAKAAQAVQILEKQIPDGESVAATNNVAPQLVADHDVTLFPRLHRDRSTPQWLMVDTETYGMFPTSKEGVRTALEQVELGRKYRVVDERNSIVLLEHR